MWSYLNVTSIPYSYLLLKRETEKIARFARELGRKKIFHFPSLPRCSRTNLRAAEKLPICSRPSKSFEVIFTFESFAMEMPGEKRKRGKRNARLRGVGRGSAKSGDNPFIRLSDECRSTGTLWVLGDDPLRAYCLVSTGPHPRPSSVRLRLRLNLFIYALLRHHPPALKDSVNWLEIDFADVARLRPPRRRMLHRFWEKATDSRTCKVIERIMNLIIWEALQREKSRKAVYIFCKANYEYYALSCDTARRTISESQEL